MIKFIKALFDTRVQVLVIREDGTCEVNKATFIGDGRYVVMSHYSTDADQTSAIMLNADGTIGNGAKVNPYRASFVKWEALK